MIAWSTIICKKSKVNYIIYKRQNFRGRKPARFIAFTHNVGKIFMVYIFKSLIFSLESFVVYGKMSEVYLMCKWPYQYIYIQSNGIVRYIRGSPSMVQY